MFGQWSVCRVKGQRAFGGVLLVEDGDGLFSGGELRIVDLAQIKDVALDRISGSTATFHDAPVSVNLPVLFASMAAQEHRPTSYPEIREPRQDGRPALLSKSLAKGVQRVVFPSKTVGRPAQISEKRCAVAKVRLGSERGQLGRRQKARPVGTHTLNVAQEPGELDGKVNPAAENDGPETMYAKHKLPYEEGAPRHLRAEGFRGNNEGVPKLLFLANAMRGQPGGPSEMVARAAKMVEGHLEGILVQCLK
jgi:hypothetical protein